MDTQRAFLPIALGPLLARMAFCPQQCKKRLLSASDPSSFPFSYTTATVSRTSLMRRAAIAFVPEADDLFTGPVITSLPCQRIVLLAREREEAWAWTSTGPDHVPI